MSSSACSNRYVHPTQVSVSTHPSPQVSALSYPQTSLPSSKLMQLGLEWRDLSLIQSNSVWTHFALSYPWAWTSWGSPTAPSWQFDSGTCQYLWSTSSSISPHSVQVYKYTWARACGFSIYENPSICQAHLSSKHHIHWPWIRVIYLLTPLFWPPDQKPIWFIEWLTIQSSKTKIHPNHSVGFHLEISGGTPSNYLSSHPFKLPKKSPKTFPGNFFSQNPPTEPPYKHSKCFSYYHPTSTPSTHPISSLSHKLSIP